MRVSGMYVRRAYGESWRTGWQWQPETYEHRTEVGGDGGKVPPMIVSDLTAPEPPSATIRNTITTLFGCGA